MNLYPLPECVERANKMVQEGWWTYQKFTCAHCKAVNTIDYPNVFYKKGRCQDCNAVTDLMKDGCNYMAVAPHELRLDHRGEPWLKNDSSFTVPKKISTDAFAPAGCSSESTNDLVTETSASSSPGFAAVTTQLSPRQTDPFSQFNYEVILLQPPPDRTSYTRISVWRHKNLATALHQPSGYWLIILVPSGSVILLNLGFVFPAAENACQAILDLYSVWPTWTNDSPTQEQFKKNIDKVLEIARANHCTAEKLEAYDANPSLELNK
jgi:hypothetical protein